MKTPRQDTKSAPALKESRVHVTPPHQTQGWTGASNAGALTPRAAGAAAVKSYDRGVVALDENLRTDGTCALNLDAVREPGFAEPVMTITEDAAGRPRAAEWVLAPGVTLRVGWMTNAPGVFTGAVGRMITIQSGSRSAFFRGTANEGDNSRQVYDRIFEHMAGTKDRLANYKAAQIADGPDADYTRQIAAHQAVMAAGAEKSLPSYRQFAAADDIIRPF